MRKLFAQFTVAMLVAAPLFASAEEIIIDNKLAQTTGSWQASKGSHVKYGDDYLFSSSTDASEPSSTAKFVPKISSPGRYDVDIWYVAGDNRSITAPVTVSCKSGTTVYKIDEKRNNGKWVSVAKGLEFSGDLSEYIMLGNNTGSTGSVVVADAIRLVQTSGGGYAISVSTLSGGKITKEPNSAGYDPGATVQLTAVPDDGFVFAGWTGDAAGAVNPLSITMDKDKSVGATFVQGGLGVIVEADEAEYKGTWEDGDKKWGKPHSDAYKWISGGKGKVNKASATFTPNLQRSGLYDIYVWYVPGGNRSQTAPFEISCKSGVQTVKINQSSGGNDWVLLAAGKEFDAGKKGYVRVSNDVEEPSSVVVADAVAFVYAGGASPEQTAKR